MIQQETLNLNTQGRGIYDITKQVTSIVENSGIQTGLCQLFCPHTSASLILTENYDPDVKIDIEVYLSTLVEDGDPRFTHTLEGKDDMAAHLRTLLTQSNLAIPIQQRALGLGRWQGICFYEHRYHAHQRTLIITLLGE